MVAGDPLLVGAREHQSLFLEHGDVIRVNREEPLQIAVECFHLAVLAMNRGE